MGHVHVLAASPGNYHVTSEPTVAGTDGELRRDWFITDRHPGGSLGTR